MSTKIENGVYWSHSIRVGTYMFAMCQILIHCGYISNYNEHTAQDYLIAGMYHDIGKERIPTRILLKSTPLTDKEWEILRQHPVFGAEWFDKAISLTPAFMNRSTEAEEIVRSAILYHHERWDGNGYPNQISKESIPLAARVCSIADTFDAVTHTRPYQMKRSSESAIQILSEGAGTQFDNELISIMLEHQSEWITSTDNIARPAMV